MKYYAIRQLDGVSYKKIITNWNDCKKIISNRRSEYKSFKKKEEAEKYLSTYIEEENEEDVLNNSNNYIYYVDGSYLNDKIGWGFICIKDKTIIDKMGGGLFPKKGTSRNITGELMAARMAVRHAVVNNLKNIYIVNDYQGISSYVTGSWKPKTVESTFYTDWMEKIKERINIKFIKVKGHTDNKFNDIVDAIAKKGTTL